MNSFKKNFLYNTSYQILSLIIPLITTPYITRKLGPGGIGEYSYAFSIAAYFVIFIMLGLANYGSRTISKARADRVTLSRTFFSIYWLQFFLGVFVLLLYVLFCAFISDDRKMSLCMVPYVVSGILDTSWFFYGTEQFRLITIRSFIIKAVTTVLIFCLVNSGNDVIVYSIIMTLGILASQLSLWPFLLKSVDFHAPSWPEVRRHIKPNLMLFITVIAVSIYRIMDKIMLGLITDTVQVGFYDTSEKIIQIPVAIITSLGTVMLPRMSSRLLDEDKKANERIIYVSIIGAMFITSSICFGIMGISRTFVPVYYGDGYGTCVSLYLILLPSCLFLSFGNVLRTQYLLPNEMDIYYILSAVIGAVVNFSLNMLLIPRFGSRGAAVGTLVSEACVCIFQSAACRRSLRVLHYLAKSSPLILSGFLMFLILYNISSLFSISIPSVLFLILLGAVLYCGFVILWLILYKRIFQRPYFDITLLNRTV